MNFLRNRMRVWVVSLLFVFTLRILEEFGGFLVVTLLTVAQPTQEMAGTFLLRRVRCTDTLSFA